jgi:hypothetical protein
MSRPKLFLTRDKTDAETFLLYQTTWHISRHASNNKTYFVAALFQEFVYDHFDEAELDADPLWLEVELRPVRNLAYE